MKSYSALVLCTPVLGHELLNVTTSNVTMPVDDKISKTDNVIMPLNDVDTNAVNKVSSAVNDGSKDDNVSVPLNDVSDPVGDVSLQALNNLPLVNLTEGVYDQGYAKVNF